MKIIDFSGVHTALVTPFNLDGSIDFGQLDANVAFQLDHGVDGLVPVGTTGESPTLDHDEHVAVIAAVVKAVAGRCPIMAGTGSNATAEALDLTRRARDVGADATLQVSPYYNKPSQEGLYRHFTEVADQGGLPVVLYNIPGRCAVTLAPDTIVRLAEHEMIVGLKEATGVLDGASDAALRTNLQVLSGDDSLTLPIMAVGGVGVVSVVANMVPDQVKTLVDAVASGNMAVARAQHLKLFALCRALLSLDTNPTPIKAAMARLGMDTGHLRAPMMALAAGAESQLDEILADAGLGVTPG